MGNGTLDDELESFFDEAQDWFKTWLSLWAVPLKFLGAVMGDSEPGPDTYTSVKFTVAASQESRWLVLRDNMSSGICRSASEELPVACVRLNPSELAPGKTSFRLEVKAKDVEENPGGAYQGVVDVRSGPDVPQAAGGPGVAAGGAGISVWIAIP
jgi:hypothetical protein